MRRQLPDYPQRKKIYLSVCLCTMLAQSEMSCTKKTTPIINILGLYVLSTSLAIMTKHNCIL